jgi:hypothetical protein
VKKVAVITDAVSPDFFFPAWHRYYGGLFGTANLHVVTYRGLRDAFSGIALGNLWNVDAAYDDTLRIGVIEDLIAALLRSHDVVIRCDVDEFLLPDPRHFADLADFIERNDLPYVTAQGIDVIELAEDAPLDLDAPIFGVQRHYGVRAAALNKTCVTTIPLRWAEGFHGANVPPRFAGLYNLHLKFADLKKRIAWDQTMVQGLVPGSKAHQYFSVGIEHLTSVQKFLSSRPKGGTETQAAFDARFLETVGHNPANDIHQGQFLKQDFLMPLSELGIAAPAVAAPEAVRRFSGLKLLEPLADAGIMRCLEASKIVPRLAPALVADFAGQGGSFATPDQLHIHGSYLVRQENAMLLGPNALISPDGHWSCEGRMNRAPFLQYYQSPAYAAAFPGPKPKLGSGPAGLVLDTSSLGEDDVRLIDEPVFLATPLRPVDRGRWVANMPAKIAQYRQHGAGRKFLCHIKHDWERTFLRLLGVPDEAVLSHDPGRAYICRDVMTVEYSLANMTISAWERANFYEIVVTRQKYGAYPRKLFVSRLLCSHAAPHNRMLQNEAELKAALEARGFAGIEPETLPFEVQIGMFAAAEQVIFLGRPAVYNSVFCPPGGSVITIESTPTYANVHTELFASLGLRHGVIFGEEDRSDPKPDHRRWTLDVARALPVIEAFFSAG